MSTRLKTLTCPKHRGWSAERQGLGAIRGACTICTRIWEAFEAHQKADRAVREELDRRDGHREITHEC